ncbi:MAG: peptidylprolyl isomerase [Planctomycetota bacterium]
MRILMLSVLAMITANVAAAQDATDDEGAPSDELLAVIVTAKGDIWLTLFPEEAPLTVTSFANLAQRGYYDGLKFHRVMANFMIQGGDPAGTGRGGPGYKFKDELSPNLRHDSAGVLSMANSGPGTNGSQFFITHKETPHLNDRHSVFGRVIEGQQVVDTISKDDLMTAVIIEGDTTALFAANQEQLDKWNQILDEKHPGKSTALEEAKRAEITANAPEMRSKVVALRAEIKEAVVKAEEERAKARQEFMAKYEEAQANGTKTDSGLVYLDVTVGDGAAPEPTGMVELHCTGWLTDGTKFYSSYDRQGNPLKNRATGFVPGFNEGLSTMKVGGKRILVIPSELGYGERGQPRAKIPPNAMLVFEVELLGVE